LRQRQTKKEVLFFEEKNQKTLASWVRGMIDNLVILFSTIACVVVVFRAIRLDGQLPWFGPGTEPPENTKDAP